VHGAAGRDKPHYPSRFHVAAQEILSIPDSDHSTDWIIGAGPAGLTAAYLLSKRGTSVTVIEKDEHYVGGISRTVEHDGYRFDIGGHRFFSKSKEVVDLWNEILPDDFIQRPRMSRIYYEGKFYSYPLRAFEALWNLGIVRSTLCMMSYAKAKVFPNKCAQLSGLDRQPVRPQTVFDLFQDLHRKGLGYALRRNVGRLGRAAHQGLSLGVRSSMASSAAWASTRSPTTAWKPKPCWKAFAIRALAPA
jgi:phytoene dehydrogenase-like protein